MKIINEIRSVVLTDMGPQKRPEETEAGILTVMNNPLNSDKLDLIIDGHRCTVRLGSLKAAIQNTQNNV